MRAIIYLSVMSIGVLLAVIWTVERLPGGAEEGIDPNNSPGSVDAAGRAKSALPESQQKILYRWRDPKGTVHISSEAPPAGVDVELIKYRAELHQAEVPAVDKGTAARIDTGNPAMPIRPQDIYSKDGLDKLKERVEDTATRIEQRNQQMNESREQM